MPGSEDHKKLVFCFLFNSLEIGGIQTLMIRISEWLVDRGHKVVIFAAEEGPALKGFRHDVVVVCDKELYLGVYYGYKKHLNLFLDEIKSNGSIDVFYAFSDKALYVAANILNYQNCPSRIIGGVYGPSDYGFGSFVKYFPVFASLFFPESNLFLKVLPGSCRIFMNEQIKMSLQKLSPWPVDGKVWPLPVNGKRFRSIKRNPVPGLIVSVGRLSPMKEYNIWMVDVIENLIKKGFNVQWVVYGDGPYKLVMTEAIKQKKLEQYIKVRGEISYSSLENAFEEAYLFVGMGTSLIEAALSGVPAISAIVYEDKPVSHGFMHELPDFACGEPVDGEVKSVEAMIKWVLTLNNNEYNDLSASGQMHAMKFELDSLMEKYMDIVLAAPSYRHIHINNATLATKIMYEKVRAVFKKIT